MTMPFYPHCDDRAPEPDSRIDRRRILDTLYPIPDPTDTLEQWLRYTHQDLGNMTRDGLLEERAQARLRRRCSTPEDGVAWLTERLEAIEQAIRR